MGLLLQTSMCKSPPLIAVFIDIHCHTCAEGCSIGFSTQNVSVNWFSNWSSHSHLRANELLEFDSLDLSVIYVAFRNSKDLFLMNWILLCFVLIVHMRMFYKLSIHFLQGLLPNYHRAIKLSHLQQCVKEHIYVETNNNLGLLLLTRINLNHNIDKWLHPL